MNRLRLQEAILFIVPIVALWLYPGCNREGATVDTEAHRQQIEEWRTRRLARLTAEDGWLTLVGLFWLHQGDNACGSDSSQEIILPPGRAPGRLGTFQVDGDSVRFVAERGAEVLVNDSAVTSIVLRNDNDEEGPTILRHGSLRIYLILRGEQIGVRIKDSQSPNRIHFGGLSYFPINPKWRVEATYEPYNPPRVSKIATMIKTETDYTFTGALAFTLDGREYRVDAASDEGSDELFIMFGDLTNGHETYGPGRQLYAPLPDEKGRVILDFNLAYNWPCVFTEYATCPIPPPQNRLALRIEAGEKLPPGHE